MAKIDTVRRGLSDEPPQVQEQQRIRVSHAVTHPAASLHVLCQLRLARLPQALQSVWQTLGAEGLDRLLELLEFALAAPVCGRGRRHGQLESPPAKELPLDSRNLGRRNGPKSLEQSHCTKHPQVHNRNRSMPNGLSQNCYGE